jgi:mycothiol synthase
VIELRPPTLEDVPALVELFAVLERAGGRGESEGDIRDWLTNPMLDVEADFRIGLDGDDIVGWCDVYDQRKQHTRLMLDIRVHPERAAEAYRALLDWGIARARSLAVNGAICRTWAISTDAAFTQEMERRGLHLIRHFFRMEIDLEEVEPEQPEWPNGIEVRPMAPGEERAVFDAIGDAFADHWDFVPMDYGEWEHEAVRASSFDPTLWFIADGGGEIAGFSLCRSERRPGVGHVGVLGVRPSWRRRGLGLALLLHSFHELRRRGRDKVDLGVDGENTTGAVRLYERAGMRVTRQTDAYEKALSEVDPAE